MALPFALYTAFLASAAAAAPGFWAWWLAGLVLLAVPLAIWELLAVVGYSIGRARRGDLP